ncbi:MAG: hypothetical protein V4638_09655 [Bacteroidota bacterium]
MKQIFSLLVILSAFQGLAQVGLNNAVVVGLMDKPEDRYSLEINVTELFTSNGIKAIPSLNLMKLGGSPEILGSDSIVNVLKSKGIDTYVLVYVKGFDKKIKAKSNKDDLMTVLNIGSLFPLYREEATNATFEFLFYRNNTMVLSEVIRCKNIGNRDDVIKKMRKSVVKKIEKSWKKTK